MKETLPAAAAAVKERHPKVWEAYQELAKGCAEAGPLEARTVRLVKLALAVGAGSEGAAHSHVRRALEEGLSPEEIRHVAYLAIPTLGFPRSIAALTWIDDILGKRGGA
ncbi:MAG: carboxymuconolactone decarboxylase family protein [Alphaproteobacteria bacterium]